MGEDEIRENMDIINASVQALAARNQGDQDECRASFPQWLWDQELTERERSEELMEGWLVIEVDDELENDNAIVSYHREGKVIDTVAVELKVPAVEAMRDATQSA
jgi:hypothetical protein